MGIHTQEDRHILVLAIFNGNIKDPRDFVVNFVPPGQTKLPFTPCKENQNIYERLK
jgi:hypothetical protein